MSFFLKLAIEFDLVWSAARHWFVTSSLEVFTFSGIEYLYCWTTLTFVSMIANWLNSVALIRILKHTSCCFPLLCERQFSLSLGPFSLRFDASSSHRWHSVLAYRNDYSFRFISERLFSVAPFSTFDRRPLRRLTVRVTKWSAVDAQLLLFFHVLVAHLSRVVCSRSLQLKSGPPKKKYGGKKRC